MKKLLITLLPVLLMAASCNNDHDHEEETTYPVLVEILKPSNGAVLEKGAAADVQVRFTREDQGTIHNVYVEVLNAAGAVVKTLYSFHVHQDAAFEWTGAYTPDASGQFTLRASTTDLGAAPLSQKKEISFTVP